MTYLGVVQKHDKLKGKKHVRAESLTEQYKASAEQSCFPEMSRLSRAATPLVPELQRPTLPAGLCELEANQLCIVSSRPAKHT